MSDPNQEFQPPPPPTVQAPPARKRPANLMIIGIVMFVIGLIVCVTGIFKLLPGGTGTGAAFAFWGVMLFAFSFIPLPESTRDDEPAMSGLSKVAGIFFEPSRVFKNLRIHPHWLAALLVIVVVNGIYSTAFVRRLTPERIVDYTFDKMEQSPIKPPADKMAEQKDDAMAAAKQPVQRVQTFAKSFVGTFVFVALIAALCLLGVLAFGGRMNFWQAFAAVLYSYLPIAVIGKIVSTVILFLKSPDDIHPLLGQETLLTDNLGILFKPADHPVLFALGTAIGVLSFYGLWLRAKGLTNAGTKVSSSAGWGTAITLWTLGVLISLVFSYFFAAFMS